MVLLIGIDPDAVDYTAPGTPPGLNATAAKEGRDLVIEMFAAQGDRCDLCELGPDADPDAILNAKLAHTAYDCVLIGGGLRVPQSTLPLFEAVLDAVRRHSPGTAIAFNTRPEDSVKAVARRIP
ncbi:MAG: hypothetical protein ABIS14_11670 [Sphingomonas sp.]